MIDLRLYTLLFVAFILATVIGTLTHESGHYVAAVALGYRARINYESTYFARARNAQIENPKDEFLIRIAGPLETMFTGSIGLLFLWLSRKKYDGIKKLSAGLWIPVFLSLFWLRQLLNLFILLLFYLFYGVHPSSSDEVIAATWLGWPSLSISILTGIVALAAVVVTVFKFVPASQRFTFIVSGLTGGVAGYILWFSLLGKYILPA